MRANAAAQPHRLRRRRERHADSFCLPFSLLLCKTFLPLRVLILLRNP
jgi:hypothetical protein